MQGNCLGHLLKLWADSYALEAEVKHASIALNYKRLIVTSNHSIEEIFGPDPDDKLTDRKRKALEV